MPLVIFHAYIYTFIFEFACGFIVEEGIGMSPIERIFFNILSFRFVHFGAEILFYFFPGDHKLNAVWSTKLVLLF